MTGGHTNVVAHLEFSGLAFPPNVPDQMRFHVPAFVRHDCREVGHVERGGQQLSLSNADRIDGFERPMSLAVDVVVVGGVGHKATSRPRHVPAQIGPQSEVFDALCPPAQTQPGVVKLVQLRALVDHAPHGFIEIRIAAVHDGAPQVVLRVGTVASNDVSVAHDVRSGRDDALFHGDQSLHHLENGPRSVGASHRAVVERFPRVFGQTVVRRPAARASQKIPVVGRCRDKGQNLSRRRFNGHYGAPLSFHQLLGVPLQRGVDGQGDVGAGARHGIQFRQGVAHVVAHVHQMVTDAGRASEFSFQLPLNARFSFVVAQPVSGVSVHVLPVHFSVLTHDLACNAMDILAHGLRPNGQARIPPQFR